jgi:hypothetical protein
MIEDLVKNAATGHRDCCGDMIHEGDTVITRNGHGRVVWLEGKWWLKFSTQDVERLNRYPASELRRITEETTVGDLQTCDNDCDNAVTTVCDNNPLSHILSHPLSQPKLVAVQPIKP